MSGELRSSRPTFVGFWEPGVSGGLRSPRAQRLWQLGASGGLRGPRPNVCGVLRTRGVWWAEKPLQKLPAQRNAAQTLRTNLLEARSRGSGSAGCSRQVAAVQARRKGGSASQKGLSQGWSGRGPQASNAFCGNIGFCKLQPCPIVKPWS